MENLDFQKSVIKSNSSTVLNAVYRGIARGRLLGLILCYIEVLHYFHGLKVPHVLKKVLQINVF